MTTENEGEYPGLGPKVEESLKRIVRECDPARARHFWRKLGGRTLAAAMLVALVVGAQVAVAVWYNPCL